jgi:hypothetical protein
MFSMHAIFMGAIVLAAFHSTYLQKRQPGTSYRDFQRLWRSHGDFAATIPAFWDNVVRYVHNDPLDDLTGLPGVTDEFDAVGELYYTTYETWVSMRDVMLNEVAPDEKRVFAGPPSAVRGERTVYQPVSGLYKLFTLVNFKGETTCDDAPAKLAEHAAYTMGLKDFGGRLSGYTATSARAAVAQTSSSRDVMFVHHFENEKAARTAMNSADYAHLEIAQDRLFEWQSRIVVLTRGWILKGDNN